jgi:hypothetical protein
MTLVKGLEPAFTSAYADAIRGYGKSIEDKDKLKNIGRAAEIFMIAEQCGIRVDEWDNLDGRIAEVQKDLDIAKYVEKHLCRSCVETGIHISRYFISFFLPPQTALRNRAFYWR